MHGVAIIGCGQISDLHAAAYSGSDTARIVALADPDRQGAEAKRQQWGIPEATVYTDYRDALKRGDVHIAEILVPHDLHYEIATAALAAGKHVSLQKPMTISLDQADALLRAADTAPGLQRVFENFLSYPPVRRAKAIIDSGESCQPKTPAKSCAWHSRPGNQRKPAPQSTSRPATGRESPPERPHLDEVPQDTSRSRVVKEINEFTGRLGSSAAAPQVIVTTRPNATGLPEPSPETFETVVLTDLSSALRVNTCRFYAGFANPNEITGLVEGLEEEIELGRHPREARLVGWHCSVTASSPPGPEHSNAPSASSLMT